MLYNKVVDAIRQLTVLEYFILAMIKRGGLNTVYALRQHVGLTWGGIRPTLLRLERWGLLSRSDTGKRRRRVFELTKKGDELLSASWEQLWFTAISAERDLETIVRAAWITWLFEPTPGAELACGAALKRKESAMVLRNAIPKSVPDDSLRLYHWMRTYCRIRQIEAEATALNELAELMRTQKLEAEGTTPRKEVV